MALEDELKTTRKTIVSDGYEMSVGELVNLYRDGELVIRPEFQRLFRWDEHQKTRFIESLLLGIPCPPIFVFQNDDGKWEVIDGLQRLSTIFQFIGILKNADGNTVSPVELYGTNFLPSLSGKRWIETSPELADGIGPQLQLEIKRARLRVEILKRESDPLAKYELFQRLNTGGVALAPQEVRTSVATMVNKPFFDWLSNCAQFGPFRTTIEQTPESLERQGDVELALRFFAFRNVPYSPGLDVHEYLDRALLEIATNDRFSYKKEGEIFENTFVFLSEALGSDTFKRWTGEKFAGKFLMSLYEVIATGVSHNLAEIEGLGAGKNSFLIERAKQLWQNPLFTENSGAGVRGTTRLKNLLPLAKPSFKP